ncbi:transcription factor VOZ1-like [Gossypium australe]|uniref:Transcription factor VOZ1-like n=1 Tax=Gossypium australe TaxID=47621 RepID=A0A5B6WP75_9ROSI|nr:transcription factor VOZ1-like [Gossypium australe]
MSGKTDELNYGYNVSERRKLTSCAFGIQCYSASSFAVVVRVSGNLYYITGEGGSGLFSLTLALLVSLYVQINGCSFAFECCLVLTYTKPRLMVT